MPSRLKRIYGFQDLHFVTSSCLHRKPLLGSGQARDVFLQVFERVRRKYLFEVAGYVVMPEHFHILIGEPEKGTPSTVLQVLKQRVAQRLLDSPPHVEPNDKDQSGERRHFWLPRSYDFNVYSNEKVVEKLEYMHNNPVRRGLVSSPELWEWSSFRAYSFGEKGLVEIERLNPNPTLRKKAASS
jgi:putative transposase